MPSVTSRWHGVLSKNFLPARYVKLAAVHGACAVSTCTSTVPTLSVSVIVWVPLRGSPDAGGVPTSLMLPGGGAAAGDALGSTFGFHTHPVGDADADGEEPAVLLFFLSLPVSVTSSTTPTTTTRTAAPAPM